MKAGASNCISATVLALTRRIVLGHTHLKPGHPRFGWFTIARPILVSPRPLYFHG